MHRNSQKRLSIPGATWFVTTVTEARFPFFKYLEIAGLVEEHVKLLKTLTFSQIFAYAIMPDHVHVIIKPARENNLSRIMGGFKRNTSRECNIMLKNESFIRCHPEGADSNPRLRGHPAIDSHLPKHIEKMNELKNLFHQRQDMIHIPPSNGKNPTTTITSATRRILITMSNTYWARR